MDVLSLWLPIGTVASLVLFAIVTTYKIVTYKGKMNAKILKIEERVENFHVGCNIKATDIDEIEERLSNVEQENHKIDIELAEIKVTGKNVEAIVLQIQTHFMGKGLDA